MTKKVDFWPNLDEICSCHGNAKNYRHTYKISKLAPRMNEYTAAENFSPVF